MNAWFVCRRVFAALLGGLVLLALGGCETMNAVMATSATLAADMGYISHGQAEAVRKVGDSFRSWCGRSRTASGLSTSSVSSP